MNKTSMTVAVTAALTIGLAGAASAAHDTNPSPRVASYSYDLEPVQSADVGNSQATGWTRVKALPNGKVQVKVEAWGVAPNLVHAMHLHGFDADNPNPDMGCPGPTADTDDAGIEVDTLEGVPFYGAIQDSLTTTGDTSPASGLAVTRFPIADADGHLSYERTFSTDTNADAGAVQVVVHGIDINGSGAYDFAAGSSSLTDDFPLEATIPVLCGGVAN